jgi:hypothetical protein
MKEKKLRIPSIGLDFGKSTVITGMQKNADGSMTFFGLDGKPLPVQFGLAGLMYDRAKGPKITVQIPDHGDSVGSFSSPLARFTRIVGVDTNSKEYDSEKVCVTAVCELSDVCFEGLHWSGYVTPLWALEFRQPTKDSERIGWRHALARGEELGWLKDGSSLLLVVDSHLDDLQQINRRQAPVIDDFIIPLGVSIAYASSDTASDSVLNGLITYCDRIAREVFSHATNPSSTIGSPLFQSQYTPFRAHRYWKFTDS